MLQIKSNFIEVQIAFSNKPVSCDTSHSLSLLPQVSRKSHEESRQGKRKKVTQRVARASRSTVNTVKFQSRRAVTRLRDGMRHLFSPRQHRCHVRSGCRRRLRPAVRAAVSPRRIARRAIGKKAGFPIEFIRLTSVDSVAPTMAGTNGAHRAAPRRVAGTREFRYGVESLGNCQ